MNEDNDFDVVNIEEENIPGLPAHQQAFDKLLDFYNSGTEPLDNWNTSDLVKLMTAVDAELQERNNTTEEEQDALFESYYPDDSQDAAQEKQDALDEYLKDMGSRE